MENVLNKYEDRKKASTEKFRSSDVAANRLVAMAKVYPTLPDGHPLKSHMNDPFHKKTFTVDVWLLYALETAQTSCGRVEDNLQVSTLIGHLRNTMLVPEVKCLKLHKGFQEEYRNGLLQLSNDGLLSKTGKKKTGDPASDIKIILYRLLLLYSGMRPSFISSPEKHLDDEWDFFTLEGTDQYEHTIAIQVELQHMKAKQNSVSVNALQNLPVKRRSQLGLAYVLDC
ncbi:hypothetical protein BC941DRAFT_472908 [Chlamydoabsidia padenii]|nr:hypothetical protein BC941DRAFT_472908 [Chlamydoabsidia padenii]